MAIKMEPTKSPDSLSSKNAAPEDQLGEQVRREHELYLRALADFENYRRRIERERESSARSEVRNLILPLLDVLDDFDRAIKQIGSSASPAVVEGVEAIRRKFMHVLEEQGVTPFDSVGNPFDPTMHEAIGSVRSDEFESGLVADELQRGYMLGSDVLRPARVRVAS
jgi:molecular chaperone GrpE